MRQIRKLSAIGSASEKSPHGTLAKTFSDPGTGITLQNHLCDEIGVRLSHSSELRLNSVHESGPFSGRIQNRLAVRHLEDVNSSEIITDCLFSIGSSDRCNVALTDLDRSLLERCLKRDGSAWREFVDRFASLFVHVIRHTAQARSVEMNSSDIDDLCAEIFLAVLSDNLAVLKRFKGESSLATYLTVISRRIVIREIIRRRMAEALGHVKTHNANVEMARADISEITRIENQELVQRMLEGLSEHDASVIRLFHLENKSYREIAEQLEIPENSIGPTLSRAREKLRQSLTASFG